MRKLLLSFSIVLFLFFHSAQADQLIIEPEMGREPILNVINHAKHSLKLVMYGFTDDALLNSLLQQKNKTVNVILEESPYKAEDENRKAIRAFQQSDINWHGSIPSIKLIHQKTLLIDERQAIVMTFNFTKSSFKNERNFGIIIDNPSQVNEIANTFSSDWNHTTPLHHEETLVWSPDISRDKLINLISGAKKSLQIYAQSVNDYKIVGALAKAAKKGVSIQILTSGNIHSKQADYLSRAGITLQQSKKMYIHAKVFIIDNKKAVIGSINLTKPSLDKNRELSLITQDPNVIQQLTQTFNKDWGNADGKVLSAKKLTFDEKDFIRSMKIVKKYLKQLSNNLPK